MIIMSLLNLFCGRHLWMNPHPVSGTAFECSPVGGLRRGDYEQRGIGLLVVDGVRQLHQLGGQLRLAPRLIAEDGGQRLNQRRRHNSLDLVLQSGENERIWSEMEAC